LTALTLKNEKELSLVKRKRIDLKGKPYIRELNPLDQDQKDYKILWAAYLRGSFDLPEGIEKEQFYLEVDDLYNHCTRILIVEDKNKINSGDKAPIGLITEKSDGWNIQPYFEYFPWATKQNKLRMAVNYFRMMKNANVGCVELRVLEQDVPFFNRVTTYGVLFPYNHPLGNVRGGSKDGDLYLYQVRGKEAFNATIRKQSKTD